MSAENKIRQALKYLLGPIKVIKDNKVSFFIWFIFAIVLGQLGIIANVIIRYFGSDVSVKTSLYLDSISGSFYIFGIAIVASSLGSLFANFVQKKKETDFFSLKIITIIIMILFLIVSSIIYAAVQKEHATELNIALEVDMSQMIVYLVAILIGLYGYCLLKIKTPEYAYLDDDSFNEEDDEDVKAIIVESMGLKDDGSGVTI